MRSAAPFIFAEVNFHTKGHSASFQPFDEVRCVGRNLGIEALAPIVRLDAFRRIQPAPEGIPAVARLPGNLGQR